MSKQEKLLKRFKSKPKDFTFEELVTLLGHYGYYLDNKGKTSGSRAIFVKNGYKSINIHKPHNRKMLISYQINHILEMLREEGLLWKKIYYHIKTILAL